MKPNKDFRLSKSAKRILATMTGEKRSMWKKFYIEAELSEKEAKLKKLSIPKGEE